MIHDPDDIHDLRIQAGNQALAFNDALDEDGVDLLLETREQLQRVADHFQSRDLNPGAIIGMVNGMIIGLLYPNKTQDGDGR